MAWFTYRQTNEVTVTITLAEHTDMDRLTSALRKLQKEPASPPTWVPGGTKKTKRYAKKNAAFGTLNPGPMVRPSGPNYRHR